MSLPCVAPHPAVQQLAAAVCRASVALTDVEQHAPRPTLSNTHLIPSAPGHPTDNKPLLVGGAVAAVAIAAVAASANQGGAQEATAGAPAAAAPAAPAAGEPCFGDLESQGLAKICTA